MIRRAVLVAAAAAALTLSPTVAMAANAPAYNAASYSCTVSDASPNAGVGFSVNCVGAGGGRNVTVSFTGNASRTVRANANGEVAFPMNLVAGVYDFTFTGPNGEVLGTQRVTVAGVSEDDIAAVPAEGADDGAVAVPADGADDGTVAGTNGDDQLANTGLTAVNLALGGGALVLVGAGAVVVTRRRKSELSA